MSRPACLLLLSTFLLTAPLTAQVAATWVGSTPDGELVVALAGGLRLVRLTGAQIPAARSLGARGAAFGEESRAALSALEGGAVALRCRRDPRAGAAEAAAPCVVQLADGRLLNLLLVEQGLAYAALGDEPELDAALRRGERQARIAHRGLWDQEAWRRHQAASLQPLDVPPPPRDNHSLGQLAERQSRRPAAERLRAWEASIAWVEDAEQAEWDEATRDRRATGAVAAEGDASEPGG